MPELENLGARVSDSDIRFCFCLGPPAANSRGPVFKVFWSVLSSRSAPAGAFPFTENVTQYTPNSRVWSYRSSFGQKVQIREIFVLV